MQSNGLLYVHIPLNISLLFFPESKIIQNVVITLEHIIAIATSLPFLI